MTTLTTSTLVPIPTAAYSASEQAISVIRDYLDSGRKPDIVKLIHLVRNNSHSLKALQEIRDLALEGAIQAEYRKETIASSRLSVEGRKTLADVAVEAYRGIKIHAGAPVTWGGLTGPRR